MANTSIKQNCHKNHGEIYTCTKYNYTCDAFDHEDSKKCDKDDHDKDNHNRDKCDKDDHDKDYHDKEHSCKTFHWDNNNCGCSRPFTILTAATNGVSVNFYGGFSLLPGVTLTSGTDANDHIYGSSGIDILEGKGGCNILDGRCSFDEVSYINANHGVTVNLGLTGFQDTGVSHDKLISIEGVIGSAYDDTLIASNCLNGNAWHGTTEGSIDYFLYGWAGDDTLIGGAGNGLFRGGIGSDIITGGSGNDIIYGGTENDKIDGGKGFNIMAYDTSNHSVNVDLSAAGGIEPGADGTDILKNIQGLSGSIYNDTLKGDSHDNLIIGLKGDDTLTGGGGKDTFVFNLDASLPMGGDGHDTITDFSKTKDILKFTTSHDLIISIAQINTLISSFVDDGSGFLKVNFTNGGSIDFQGVAFTHQTSIAQLVIDPSHQIQHGDLYYTQITSTFGNPF